MAEMTTPLQAFWYTKSNAVKYFKPKYASQTPQNVHKYTTTH